MSRKVLCPMHEDTRPSLHIYGDWSFCFVCHASIPTNELDVPANFRIPKAMDPEDLVSKLNYIDSLPRKVIRGLSLPYDVSGYYVVWPNRSYYKRRNWEGDNRYTSPRGITKPLLIYPGTSKTLCIVEGELNAISLQEALCGETKVCSPGPAGDILRYIRYYLEFPRIALFVDYDAPGVVFGAYLKDILLKHKKQVALVALRKDFNDLLQEGGEEAVRQAYYQNLDVPWTA